jgi:hypothetical protein
MIGNPISLSLRRMASRNKIRNRIITVKGSWKRPFTVIVSSNGTEYNILNWRQFWCCEEGYYSLQRFKDKWRIENIVHIL